MQGAGDVTLRERCYRWFTVGPDPACMCVRPVVQQRAARRTTRSTRQRVAWGRATSPERRGPSSRLHEPLELVQCDSDCGER